MSSPTPAPKYEYSVEDRNGTIKVPTGQKQPDAYFEYIYLLSGLDKGMACAIMHGGNPIKYPGVTFRARQVMA